MLFTEEGVYKWSTENYHINSHISMLDFLDNHIPDGFIVNEINKNQAEIQSIGTDAIYTLIASEDVDAFHHKIEWKLKRINYDI